jgi:hypothetical protein
MPVISTADGCGRPEPRQGRPAADLPGSRSPGGGQARRMLEGLRARFRRRRDPAEQHCEGCGAALRVEGTGRHSIYRHEGEPVLGDSCPACGAPLPGKPRHDAAATGP